MANKPKWTPEQQHAIGARGGTLIVRAAAGSGKTAVLVERCIQRLTDTEHPCSADELLIVTFTRAATAEMRSRLAKAISDRLVEDPENTHLQKQQMLLPSAQICTIDAFCGNLVRENFESLGISPDFRLLDESEVRVLQQNAMDRVVEEFYTAKDPDFLGLVELLATGRDDTSLEGNILRLYTYSRAYPSPKHWLENGLSLYEDPSPAYRLLKESWAEYFDSWVLRWEHFQRLLEKEQGQSDLDYSESVESVKGYIALAEEFLELLENEDWAGFLTRLTGLSQADIPTWKKPSLPKKQTTAVIEYGKGLKSSFTPGKLRDVLKKLPMTLPEEAAKDLSLLRPYARKLVDTVLRFDEVYGDLKKEANALDFADT
ncbi:MAG: UvrD-helicase domain-containing protein, partial [Clostridia bacterium]|nr:UvrD-helicase domain-containing protein [Clostridia bacterium]